MTLHCLILTKICVLKISQPAAKLTALRCVERVDATRMCCRAISIGVLCCVTSS